MAVYGQLTGKPKDDPPPPSHGLPSSPPEDQGPSDGGTTMGSDESLQRTKPSDTMAKDFRQVEGSKDSHMKWTPPANYRKASSGTY